jgi:hypothetical protein
LLQQVMLNHISHVKLTPVIEQKKMNQKNDSIQKVVLEPM